MATKKEKAKDAASGDPTRIGVVVPTPPMRAASPGNALRLGTALGVLALVPQLWPVVAAGGLDLSTALERAGLVSLAVGVGATYVLRIVDEYRDEIDRREGVERAMTMLEGMWGMSREELESRAVAVTLEGQAAPRATDEDQETAGRPPEGGAVPAAPAAPGAEAGTPGASGPTP